MESEFYRTKLDNGLIVLLERRKSPVVASLLAYRLGAAHEPAEFKGVAHYLEHCIFQGTKTKSSKEISAIVDKRGGVLNGFTDEEVTAFWTKLPSKYLDLGVDLLSDMLTNPAFDGQKIEKEKKVVLEEVKMHHDTPTMYVFERAKSFLYEKPFGMEIVGTEETIKPISREILLKFFKLYNNPILCVVGGADFDEVIEFAKRKITVKRAFPSKLKINKINKQAVERRKGLKQAHLVLAFHTATLRDGMRYALESFNAVLSGGGSSRLFQEIRDKRGLAYHVGSYPQIGVDYGHNLIYVGTDAGHIKQVKELILKEIKKMRELDKKEFEESKEQLIGLYKLLQEDSNKVALALLKEELAGSAEEFYRYEQRISELKLQDVRELGKLKRYSFVALVPE
ncbi:MAG: M16 family metallopeptidase [Candidatus Hadarchaeaceae archaeon]|nr:insulinase family protein [Hadesarchaea archaeon]